MPSGLKSPVAKAIKRKINSNIDNEIRKVRAFTVFSDGSDESRLTR